RLGGRARSFGDEGEEEDAGHDEGNDGDDDRQQVGRQHGCPGLFRLEGHQGEAGHGRVVHARDGHAEGGGRKQQRRPAPAPAGERRGGGGGGDGHNHGGDAEGRRV